MPFRRSCLHAVAFRYFAVSVSILGVVAMLSWSGSAEAQSASNVTFDVASVKPASQPGGLTLRPRRSGDRILWPNALPIFILEYAFDVNPFQITGQAVPQAFYNIEAIVTGAPTEKEVRLMFQDLLERRFGLKLHRELRAMSVYTLNIAPKGARLGPTREDVEVKVDGRPLPINRVGDFSARDGSHVAGKAGTIDQLAEALSEAVGAVVVNETGIEGQFDFDLLHARENMLPSPDAPILPSIKTVIEDQLGLRLRSAKRSITVLVVDAFGSPTPN
jgi:uncharacterized protein (TIGR03435 family)